MNSLIKTAVVPVAGLGTRLLPISAAIPKELLPLGSKPTLQYIIEELGRSGIDRIIFVTSEEKKNIAQMFMANHTLEQRLAENNNIEALSKLWSHSAFKHMTFETTIQAEQLGLGHAVLCSQELAGSEPITVALGDCVIGMNGSSDILRRMTEVYNQHSADIVIAFEEVPTEKVSRFGIAKPNLTDSNTTVPDVFELSDLVEKPSPEEAPSNLAVSARYIFSPRIFESLAKTLPGKGNEIQLTDAIRTLIHSGARAFGVRLNSDEERFDVGNINSYTQAFVRFAMADAELKNDVSIAIG